MTTYKINKPAVLEQEFMRASDIANEFPICLSTAWGWAKKGRLTPIKVSSRVTVFRRAEVQNLFSYSSNETIEVQKKVRSRKKRKVIAIDVPKIRKKPVVSDENMIDIFLEKQNSSNKMISVTIPIRKKVKKLPPTKEGIIGTSRKLKKRSKNV